MNVQELDDKTLFQELQKAALVDKLESSEEWKMLREAATRIIERAIYEFALKTEVSSDPKDLSKVIRLQQIIRLYKFGLFKEVEILAKESDILFNEAKDRGIVGAAWDDVKEKIHSWTE